jgi:hypothetical protein
MAKQPKTSRTLAPIGDYDVGYCKPPKEYQFKKDQPSANKNGRPKGSRNSAKANPLPIVDIPIHQMSLEEAIRPIQVRDGDKVIKIPAYQAGVRATLRNAAKGSNPAMRNAQLIMSQAHQQARFETEERVNAALLYKREAIEHLRYCNRVGRRFDWEFHPDDIHIDLETGEVYFSGPTTMEERAFHNALLDQLDHAIKRMDEIAAKIRENPRLRKERERLGLFVLYVNNINELLAPHWQKAINPEMHGLAIMPDPIEDEGQD